MSTIPSMPTASHQLPRLALVVAARAAIWVAWLLGVFMWVPRVENVFQRLNVRLPSGAALVVALTHGLVPLGLLVVLVFIALDGSVSLRLRRRGGRTLWSGLMTIAPIAAIFLTSLAVARPMLLILEHITK